MTKVLFNEFPQVSAKAWKQKIQVDLKGLDYNDTLIWKTNEGIDVKPFYHKDTFESIKTKTPNKSDWNICQTIFVFNVEISNLNAINVINRGAESIKFIIPNETISLENLLQNIDLTDISLFFELQFLSSAFVKKITNLTAKGKTHINTDIIGNLVRTGNWFTNLNNDHEQFKTIVNDVASFSVDVSIYQNAGANQIQQLAYALAHTNEYFNYLDTTLDNKKKQSFNIVFNVSVGSNYFFEIAKLRAIRILYKALAGEYGFNTNCHIFVTPTKRNKTIYDYNTNMLRTTTECMSAILGGANTIYNSPYDAIYHKNNEFGNRISRNQLLILKHESYFDKVGNPSEGSYYIETITSQIAEKSLTLFKNIEANGGFLKQLKEGIIQRKIKESALKEQEQFDSGKIVLLGTNKYPNPDDKMANELELFPFVKRHARKTLIEPIIEKRLAEKSEQERLKTE